MLYLPNFDATFVFYKGPRVAFFYAKIFVQFLSSCSTLFPHIPLHGVFRMNILKYIAGIIKGTLDNWFLLWLLPSLMIYHSGNKRSKDPSAIGYSITLSWKSCIHRYGWVTWIGASSYFYPLHLLSWVKLASPVTYTACPTPCHAFVYFY